MSKRLDYEYVKDYIEKENYKLISVEYKKSADKLNLICPKNHNIWISFNNFKKGKRCGVCFGNNYLNYQTVKNFIEIESGSNCILLSEDYINNVQMLKIKCNCGSVFKTTFAKFNNRNKRQCNNCGNLLKNKDKAKIHSKFVEEIYNLVANEYTILGQYVTSKTPILIKHNVCGNEYYVTPSNFNSKHNQTRCPKCKSSKSEKETEKILNKNKIIYKKQFKFDNCKNIFSLPFDFAIFDNNEKLIILLELDGEQHYKPVRFGGVSHDIAEKNYKLNKIRDDIKNEYCEKNNIRLLRISYIEFKNIEQILINELNR
jgi:very-short-patch-repair endonuclease